MRNALLLIAVVSALGGCSGSPSTPPTLGERIQGWSIHQVKAEFGSPNSEQTMTKAPDFGPYPAALPAGDSCVSLYYQDLQGEMAHIYCVAPDVYAKVTGKSPPGDEESYVLEVFTYPPGTVF